MVKDPEVEKFGLFFVELSRPRVKVDLQNFVLEGHPNQGLMVFKWSNEKIKVLVAIADLDWWGCKFAEL